MSKRSSILFAGLVLTGLLLTAGCGGRRIAQQSVLDTPQTHYAQGKRLLDAGRLDEAEREFARAQGLNPDFAPAYEGAGLIALARGDASAAQRAMDQAREKDENYAPAYIGLGRAKSLLGKYDDAVKEFRMALRKDPGNGDAHFYWGEAALAAKLYDAAESEYASALAANPLDIRADAAWKRVNEIRRAGAGVSAEYGEIASKPGITRADFAVILTTELPVDRLFRGRQAKPAMGYRPPGTPEAGAAETPLPGDVTGHWARTPIEKTLALGLMEPRPDGLFGPDDGVSRVDFAMLIQQFLVVYLEDPSLSTRLIGSPSPFPDVPGSHYAFNAVMTATSRGILKAELDGTFRPAGPVSGADALLAVRKLQEQLK